MFDSTPQPVLLKQMNIELENFLGQYLQSYAFDNLLSLVDMEAEGEEEEDTATNQIVIASPLVQDNRSNLSKGRRSHRLQKENRTKQVRIIVEQYIGKSMKCFEKEFMTPMSEVLINTESTDELINVNCLRRRFQDEFEKLITNFQNIKENQEKEYSKTGQKE